MEISTISTTWYPTVSAGLVVKKFLKRNILCRCVRKYPPPVSVNELVAMTPNTKTFDLMIVGIIASGGGEYQIPPGVDDVIGYLLKNNEGCLLHKLENRYRMLFIMSEFSTCPKCNTWFTRCKLCGETATWNDFNEALANLSHRFSVLHDGNNIGSIKIEGNAHTMEKYCYTNYLLANKRTVSIKDPDDELAQNWVFRKVPLWFRFNTFNGPVLKLLSKMRGNEESYFVQISNKTGYEVVKIVYESVKILCGDLTKIARKQYTYDDHELSITVKHHILHNCGFEYSCMFCELEYESFPSEEVYIKHIETCKTIQSPYFEGKKYYEEIGSRSYDNCEMYLKLSLYN